MSSESLLESPSGPSASTGIITAAEDVNQALQASGRDIKIGRDNNTGQNITTAGHDLTKSVTINISKLHGIGEAYLRENKVEKVSDANSVIFKHGGARATAEELRAILQQVQTREIEPNNQAHTSTINITVPRTEAMENIAILNEELRSVGLELSELAKIHSSLSMQGRGGSQPGVSAIRDPDLFLGIQREGPGDFTTPMSAAEQSQVQIMGPPGSTIVFPAPSQPVSRQSSDSRFELSQPMRTPSLTRSSDDNGDDEGQDLLTPSLTPSSSSSSSRGKILALSFEGLKVEQEEQRKQTQELARNKAGPQTLDHRDFTDSKHWQAKLMEVDPMFSDSSNSSANSQSNRISTPSRRPAIEVGPQTLDHRDFTDSKHWQAKLMEIDPMFSDSSNSSANSQSNRISTPSRRPAIEVGPQTLDHRDFTDFKHWQAKLMEINLVLSDSSNSSANSQSNRILTPGSETNKEFFEETVLCTEPQELIAVGANPMRDQDVLRGLGTKSADNGHPDSTVVTLSLEIRDIGS